MFHAHHVADVCTDRRGCGLKTVFVYQVGLVLPGVGAMNSASASIEFDIIARKEADKFHMAVDAFARDGSLPHECVFTELSRRMVIIRNVSGCPHVYNGWKNIAALVDTWSDRDKWEAGVAVELREKALSASSPTGSASNCMYTLQRTGATDHIACMVSFQSWKCAAGQRTYEPARGVWCRSG